MRHQWLFSTADDDVVGDYGPDGRIVLGDGPVEGFLEHSIIRDGISLFRASGRSQRSFAMEVLGGTPSDNLILGCMLSGSGVLEAEGNADQSWREPSRVKPMRFRCPDGMYATTLARHNRSSRSPSW